MNYVILNGHDFFDGRIDIESFHEVNIDGEDRVDVIFGEFKIYNEPYLLYYQLVSNSNIATNDIHFVLDITSLILITIYC